MNPVGPAINHPCTLCCRPTSMWCSRCQNAWYCTPEHLQTDWPRHRRECIPTTHAQNYSMIATPPNEQQMITVSAILFEPEEERPRIITVKCRPPQVPSQGMCPQPLMHFPHGQTESIVSMQDLNGEPLRSPLHPRYSQTTLRIPMAPEAHKQPSTDCSSNFYHFSYPNGRECIEPISCGTPPEDFQSTDSIEGLTCDVEFGCEAQGLGFELTGYSNAYLTLESYNNRTLEHHSGRTCTPVTLNNAIQETLMTGNQINKYASCPSTPCLWTDGKGRECLEPISCSTVPEHSRDVHSIKDLKRDYPLDCTWRGCGRRVMRHNYVRHVRECHLKHDRVSAHNNQAKFTYPRGVEGSESKRCTGASQAVALGKRMTGRSYIA
ncbi:hypothetical protein EDC04DRAFT_3106200 [Pisolithus marmoratus]|nr:hypothetical protein EDC04DRAFT_3106200 [Pisolithus marmoratus]